MPERLIGAVLKTVVPSRVPWVRIPLPPPFKEPETISFRALCCKNISYNLTCSLRKSVDEIVIRHLKLKCLTHKMINFKFEPF